jgi:uncharacterized protein
MKRAVLALSLVALCLLPAAAWADEVAIPSAPGRWATDTAGFVGPQTLQAIDARLEGFERTTGNQVLVWIGTTTGDTPLEDWTIHAFEQWKVGRKGLDNGLILFVFAADHRARIEVGYGLEDKVPDAIASRVLNDIVLPRIKAGDNDGALQAGVEALCAAVSGTADASADTSGLAAGTPAPARELGPKDIFKLVIFGLLAVGFLILLITNPSLALYILYSILSSGGGGRSGGGGGGFSGGGGRSGGGGASGSW